MSADYYVLLDIPRRATQHQIKSAYRRKAKELHPDTCGGDRERFQDVQQAYEVLSDPERRRAYDATNEPARRPVGTPLWQHMGAKRRAEPLRSASHPVEPLIPDARPKGDQGWDAWRRADTRWGSGAPEDLYDREALSFWEMDEDTRADEAYVEVSLTPEQARYGGRVEVRIALQVACPACRGRGGRGVAMCARCAGRGRIDEVRRLQLVFPGNIVDGDIARLSLAPLGIPDAVLTVLFLVDGW